MIPLETIIPNKHRIRVVLDSFHEWLRGLDFTMPDRMYDRKRNDGGMYLVSSEKIVSELMGMVDKQKYPGFLDVPACSRSAVRLCQLRNPGCLPPDRQNTNPVQVLEGREVWP